MRLRLRPLPPREAIEAFRRRGADLKPTGDWTEMAAEEHARAFTVAQSIKADILRDVYEALDAAQAQGQSFAEFRKGLEPLLRRKGWWGKEERIDPDTGELRTVRLGTPHRLRTIFQTNLRVSHAVGRARRIVRHAATRPWLEYVAVLDHRTRPMHRAWDGVVLRYDDPWWDTHTPPNGWLCRCTVVSHSDKDLARRGLKPGKAPRSQTREWHNKRTGMKRRVPVGIDPGWDHNPGVLGVRAGSGAKLYEAVDRLAQLGRDGAEFAARLLGLDEVSAKGREIREKILALIHTPEGAQKFRVALEKSLRLDTGAAAVPRALPFDPNNPMDVAAAQRVRDVGPLLPGAWVRRANDVEIKVRYNGNTSGGRYVIYKDGRRVLDVSDDPGNALHEYAHHLQHQRPALNAYFLVLHRRRTSGDAQVPLHRADGRPYFPDLIGRPDNYVDGYFGLEYGPAEEPREVMTRALQTLWFPVYERELLPDLIRRDSEMLDLTLGLLFGYGPKI